MRFLLEFIEIRENPARRKILLRRVVQRDAPLFLKNREKT
jgi:hypothetical protein